jgi:CheY-like chemotaxis protein
MARILVIDDDRDLTAMLAEYLEPEGFIVDAAHTGEDGLVQALATDYSLNRPRRDAAADQRSIAMASAATTCTSPVLFVMKAPFFDSSPASCRS